MAGRFYTCDSGEGHEAQSILVIGRAVAEDRAFLADGCSWQGACRRSAGDQWNIACAGKMPIDNENLVNAVGYSSTLTIFMSNLSTLANIFRLVSRCSWFDQASSQTAAFPISLQMMKTPAGRWLSP